jgi:hypothetical protein
VGKYVYEIVDGGKFVEFGVLSDHLFKARGYTGSGVQHAMADPAPTDVVVQIPGETIERVRAASRNLSLVMWEILPGFEDKDGTISRDEFLNGRSNDKMMRRTGEVTADVIKKILMTPSP